MDDQSFLEKLGGYRKDRKTGVEGLTLAGLLMFGTGQAIRERFDNVFMDYRNESQVTADIRWNDRITYDGTWENNLFNFFTKVTPKLTEDLKKPFKLEGGVQRIDDTPVHKAVREGFVNMIIHADYLMDAGVLKVIKKSDAFEFTNPGILKLPLEDIYRGGNSKSRNPHMQTMLRLVGFGDNAGSGFPTILDVWKSEGWIKPELIEDTNLDQVTLMMKMEKESDDESAEKSALEIWKKALDNVTPQVEVKSRRVGGATFQVPTEIRPDRKESISMKNLILFARKRGGKSMADKLAAEIMDAFNEQGGAYKRKEDMHRMAEANRAFAHFRF